MSEVMQSEGCEPDYRAAMLYHCDRADRYLVERDALAARIADLERQLAEAREALAVSAGRLTWCAGILPSDRSRDLVSEWAEEARILSALKGPTP